MKSLQKDKVNTEKDDIFLHQ